jgi:hypothetical protein
MKNHIYKIILLSIPLLLTACGPKDYDDCILQNLKGVNNDDAIWEIKNSCREKFPEKSDEKVCKRRELTKDEKAKLDIRLGLNDSTINVRVYNGNESLNVYGKDIEITASNFDLPQKYEMYFLGDGVYLGGIMGKKFGDASVRLAFKPAEGWEISEMKFEAEVCK